MKYTILQRIVIIITILMILISITLRLTSSNVWLSFIPLGIGYIINVVSYIYYKLNIGGIR